MKYWTWSEIREKIEQECDLEDEDFVRRAELLAYVNEAIDEAEAEIHTLYEDYFLTFVDIPITALDEFISLSTHMPSIYADKIREIIFTTTGGTVYTITRLKDWRKFKEKAMNDQYSAGSGLMNFFLVNRTPGNPEALLTPKAPESGSARAWFIRNANRLVDDTDVCDIPEFINFVIAFTKWKVYGKEGHPGYDEAERALEKQRNLMNAALSNRTPDMENEVEMDMSSYEDMN